jgi:hypothetical protein
MAEVPPFRANRPSQAVLLGPAVTGGGAGAGPTSDAVALARKQCQKTGPISGNKRRREQGGSEEGASTKAAPGGYSAHPTVARSPALSYKTRRIRGHATRQPATLSQTTAADATQAARPENLAALAQPGPRRRLCASTAHAERQSPVQHIVRDPLPTSHVPDLTAPVPFKLTGVARHEQHVAAMAAAQCREEAEGARRRDFHAQPVPRSLHEAPARVAPSTQELTDPAEVVLATETLCDAPAKSTPAQC